MNSAAQMALAATLVLAWGFPQPTRAAELWRAELHEPWRAELYDAWKKLPEPPITPYSGPFGNEARAFVGKVDWNHSDKEAVANWQAQNDYSHTAKNGVYDPAKDPRPINVEFEKAMLEDWRRMGYNCAYKGGYFTFMVGDFLKQQGMLGAIDQTLFGQNGPPPVGFDGAQGSRQREACGSFFHPENFQAGIDAIAGMGHHYGHHLFTVGDHKLTCSWDEVGMRTRAQLDYHENASVEFRKFLKEVWFQDASPNQDTNGDGRTYNAFTGEKLSSWDQVEPIELSLNWTMPGYNNDGTAKFSARPEVDRKLFDETGRYKLWIDFHRYFTFEFFRRVNEEATQQMNSMGTQGRISCYPFVQHFIIWPGMNQRHGNSFYWYHRLSPVVNVEHCWPEAPVMNLNYAITDRLAPRWKNRVMGWVWFYFGHEGYDMYNGPHDMDRAMARMMGHVVDGSHHWLYSPIYRSRDREQRLQIAYWQNFLARHYQTFLSRSAPPQPEIALLMPDWTGYYYRAFQYPKQDWAYTAEALQNLQYPYHIITEEELTLDGGTLDGYKALYVVGSEWTTPTVRGRIRDFIDRGGVVFSNVDSLSLDIPTGERSEFLETTFGVKIDRKHKNAFFPSTQSAEEAEWAVGFDRWGGNYKLQGHNVHHLDDPRAWAKLYKRTAEKYVLGDDGKPKRDPAGRPIRHPDWKLIRGADGHLVRDETAWQTLDDDMAKMPAEVRGLAQSPIDMRNPPEIRYAETLTNTGPAVTWGEVNTATVTSGKPIAWWGEQICGVETDKTVWLGTREGTSIHAISPRLPMHRTTEPCNPFPTEVYENYEARRPYAEVLGYAARKAGVKRPVTLSRTSDDEPAGIPLNLEVLSRVDDQGTLMVIAIDHDAEGGSYQVTLDDSLTKILEGAEAWNMLGEEVIENNTDGRFEVEVPAWGVSVFLVGKPANLAPIKAAQHKLNAKDMTVPQYFLDRPELNEPEYNTPVPEIE